MSLPSICADLSSPHISARLVGHLTMNKHSPCKTPQLSAIFIFLQKQCRKLPPLACNISLTKVACLDACRSRKTASVAGLQGDGLHKMNTVFTNTDTASPRTKNPQTKSLGLDFRETPYGPYGQSTNQEPGFTSREKSTITSLGGPSGRS